MEIFDYAKDQESAERGYVAWTKQHPHGFIINQSGKKIMLHVTSCNHFYGEDSGRLLTKNRKICSASQQELESWATEHGPSPLQYCSDCKTG